MSHPKMADSILRGTRVRVTYPTPPPPSESDSPGADFCKDTNPSSQSLNQNGPRHGTSSAPATADVHVLDVGDPAHPTLVFLSGLAVPWFDWQDLVLQLSSTRRVLVIDRAGAGLSGPVPFRDPSPLLAEAEVVRQVLDAKSVSCAVVVGHSMGALVAEAFARNFPKRCAGLALFDPSFESSPSHTHDAEDGGGAGEISAVERRVPVPLPAFSRFVFRQARAVLSSRLAARTFASLRLRFARTKLRSADDEDVEAVNRAVFTRSHVLDGVVREYASYDLWTAQLAELRSQLPLSCGALVVAARLGPRFLTDSWVEHLRNLAAVLAAEVGPRWVDFEVVEASHLLMRDVPEELAGLLLARWPGD